MSVQAAKDLHELHELHEKMRHADLFSIRALAQSAAVVAERLLNDLHNRLTFVEHQAPTHLASNLAMEAVNDDGR